MTIAVDSRWMVGEFRGMGHYAATLVTFADQEVTRLVPRGQSGAASPSIQQGWSFFPYWEQVALPDICHAHHISHLICPYNTAPVRLARSTKLIVVVHDLIYLEPWSRLPPSRSMYQTLGRIYRRWNVPRAVRRADHLLTVSEYSRGEICERFGLAPEKVRMIPNSLGDDWFVTAPLTQSERAPYLLTVAGEAPHKNLPALLEAFAGLLRSRPAQETLTLRVVGVKATQGSDFIRRAGELGISDRIVFEPFLAEPALRKLYQQARLFVLPSLYEGFGIPVLEAMASGTPVACSNTCSLPEVLGGSGWLFDPRNTQQMSAVIAGALANELDLERAAQRGLERAQRYRRSSVAVEIREFWRTL